MYESFYKLTTKPFRLSPDPQFFYPSAGHKRALSYLLYGLNQGEGFVVITGTPGTGKTTLAHKLLSQIDTQSMLVAHLTSTQIEAEDLLRLVAASFKLRSENVSKAGLLKDIESFLLARSRERKRCLLVVDEAQNLPPRSIEELRMLSNFQVGSKALLQIFLLGQEQFRTMLNSPNFEQLRQRVIADYHLQPLDAEDTRRYIEARLRFAGWQNDPQFDTGAFTAIFEYTRGLPRRINMFCDRLMLYGFLEGLHLLTAESVGAVINELGRDGTARNEKVVYTAVEHSDVRAASASQAPVTRAAHPAPADVTSYVKPVETPATIPVARARAEAVIQEQRPPAISAAPPAAPVERRDQPSVFAPKIERETRGESAAPPLRVDQSPPSIRPPEPLPGGKGPQSLAVAESRWLSLLVGTIAVLLALALWFYPQILSVFTTVAQSTSPPPSQAVAEHNATVLESTPPGMTHDSITTEHPAPEILPSPAESVTATHRSGTDGGAALMIQTSNGTSPEVALSNEATTTTATATVAPEQPPPAAPVPEVRPARNKVSSKRMPVVPAAPTAPAAPAAPAISATPAVPPIAAKESVAPVAVTITERELALLLLKFSRTYEQGDLTAFITLFDPDVSTEDHNTVEAVRHDYAELFRKTAARQITFGSIRWDISGDVAHGTGPFEVRVRATPNDPYRTNNGTVRLRVQKKGRGVLITALYHKAK